MMKLDDKIAAAFKVQKTPRSKKEEEKQMMHFKNRCLDLLQHFVHNNPPASLAKDLITPLLKILESSVKSKDIGKDIGQRATHVFNALYKTKKVCYSYIPSCQHHLRN